MKRANLINSLSQISGNAIASIETITTVSLLGGKKNPMKDRITKRSTGGRVQLFGNSKSNGYANMKNRANAKKLQFGEKAEQEKFVPKPRKWGNRVNNTPLVFHKDKVYCEVVYLKAPSKVEYFIDGTPIAKENIEGLKPSRSTGKSDIALRDINIDNIVAFNCGDLSVR